MSDRPHRPEAMGAVIAVRVTPRSSRPGIRGWREGADGRAELEVHVSPAPTDGSANEAVIKLLAGVLGVSRSEVTIISGHSARHKRIAIPCEVAEARRRLGV